MQGPPGAGDGPPGLYVLASPESYLSGASNVFAYAEGRSFYERLFPEAQVHVGWNAIAVHWLSSVPTTIPDHIWSNMATGAVKEAYARQSREDWQQFLTHRGHELKAVVRKKNLREMGKGWPGRLSLDGGTRPSGHL